MHFKIDFSEIKRSVSMVSEIIPGKSMLGDLSSIRIRTTKDSVEFSSFSDNIFCFSSSLAEVKEEGNIIVDSLSLLKSLSGMRTLKADGTGTQTLKFVAAEGHLRMTTATKYSSGVKIPHRRTIPFSTHHVPNLPSLSNTISLLWDQEVLSEAISFASPFVLSDESRGLIFTGISVSVDDDIISMEAYNGPAWSRYKGVISSGTKKLDSFLIPGRFLSKLPKFISKLETVEANLSKSLFYLSGKDFTCGSSLIHGEFPDLTKVFEGKDLIFDLDKTLFLENLRNLSFTVSSDDRNRVTLMFKESGLSIQSKDSENSDIPIQVFADTSSKLTTYKESGFAADFDLYLLESIIRAVPSDYVRLCFSSPIDPVIVRPLNSNTNACFIVTPLR